MFNLCQNRYKDDRRKSVTPAVIRLEVQIIITVRRKNLTSIVVVFKQQTLSSLPQLLHEQNLLPSIMTTLPTYSRRIEFMYFNVYLLTYVHIPTTTRCLSTYQRSRLSKKTRNKGYRDAINCYVPETTFHKPRFMLNVDYP